MNDKRQTRSCQVLAGDRERALALLRVALAAGVSRSCLWFGEAAPDGVRRLGRHDYLDALGCECDLLVYDAHAGLYPDVLAALLGTLRGGGVLVLLSPSWAQWAAFDDPALAGLAPWPLGSADVGRRFLQRLQDQFAASPVVRILDVDGTESLVLPPAAAPVHSPELNEDQHRVVEALLRVVTGHARRPLVLTADRGRGKSTALGAGLARLLRERSCRVAVLAPTRRAVEALFARLHRDLPDAGGEVRYWRPADFLAEAPDCDLLVIDEAAALGVPLLQTLAERYNRVVFSTTVQGYEGSGRGFVQRFLAWLNERFRACRHLELSAPVRWAPGDPLEALANRLFLLDAEALPPVQGVPRYRWLERDALAQEEALLRQVFGLLVSAHYRTRPSDLRQLLDAPGVSVLVAECAGQVIGVLLAAAEGGLDAALAEAVCAGRRRPRGHPLLQSLATHGGWCQAPTLRLLRIMRIAVDERHRRAGIGSGLLARARERAEAEGFDLLGTRYGVSPGLLRFWQHNGYRVVRIGHRVDPASAAHSVQMLASLSTAGEALCDAACARFLDDLPWRLLSGLAGLDPGVVSVLFRQADGDWAAPDAQTLADVRHFALGRRDFEDALPSLRRGLCAWLAREDAGENGALLVRCVLQGRRPTREQVAMLRRLFAAGMPLLQSRQEACPRAERGLTPARCVPTLRRTTTDHHREEASMSVEGLKAGDKAPAFELPDADMNMVRSADLAGRPYVIYFYPKDDTPGCTMEAQEFTELMDEFQRLNAALLGVSRDNCMKHAEFRDKYGLGVTLLADVDGQLCEAYGVWQERERNGEKRKGIVRSTFIVDSEGVIRHAEYGVSPKGHAEQVLEVLRSLS